ncbi:hypothetical protein BD410DRAFT_728989 [Rickenella mellea]|uniref:BTB domain-containing protein n=1 Tax=Rickenella mellea TaxID=50990 RepID=A0A4Y7PSI5_9AGAM|nr:hypothetical protein BD410DRAFT_728989 [Rickenella mellea]
MDESETQPRHHKHFWFIDGNVVFQVEKRLFKVHRYFFHRDSAVFRVMFELPQARDGTSAEGATDANPIHLEGTKSVDFERFLVILYPLQVSLTVSFTSTSLSSDEEWVSCLEFAAKWDFQSVRELAIRSLTTSTTFSPVDKIVIGRRLKIPSWLMPSYTELCNRREPLGMTDGFQLGMLDTLLISQTREKIRGFTTRHGYNDTAIADAFRDRVRL